MADEEEIDQAFKSYYRSGPLRHYYSSLNHHDAVDDYFAPFVQGSAKEDTKRDSPSPYTVVQKYRQGVEFRGKLIGSTQVSAASGEEMCRSALAKLRAALRAGKKHKQRIIIRFTNRLFEVIDQDTEEKLHSIRLHKISYILPDPNDSYSFGIVCGEKAGPWFFYGLKTVSPAIAAIVAVKELFEALSAISKGNIGPNWDNSLSVLERYKHGIEFRGKYIGSHPVPCSAGADMCYTTLNDLRTEVLASKKHKLRIVIHITNKDVFIIDQDKGMTLQTIRLGRISYVIHDPNDEHAFGFVVGEQNGPWTFYGFKTVLPSMAPISVITELVAAIGSQAGNQGHKMEPDHYHKIVERFRQGGAEFRGKFIGCDAVPAPTGDEMALTTLRKLRAAVAAQKVHKTRVVIHVTNNELTVKHPEDGTTMSSTKIRNISYVTVDPNDERAFGFVCGELTGPWYFYGFKTVLPSIAVIAAIKDLSEALAEITKRTGHRISECEAAGTNSAYSENVCIGLDPMP